MDRRVIWDHGWKPDPIHPARRCLRCQRPGYEHAGFFARLWRRLR